MATFALIHGAWHGPWAWERLVPELDTRGHTAVAPDLHGDDAARGTAGYAATVLDALADSDDDVIVVGHSLGGLTAPLVAAARPVRALVYLCALVPVPGRSLVDQLAGEQLFVPESADGRAIDDQGRSVWIDRDAAIATFYGACSPQDAAAAAARLRPQGQRPSTEPCPLDVLPDMPCHYVVCSRDRIIAPAWSREVARTRLGIEPIELDTDHSPMLSRPTELADVLAAVADNRRG